MSTWIGRYAIVDGEVVEDGPGLIDRERVREDESVRVLVFVEPSDERSKEFCAEVAEAIATLFGRETLSLSGGLLRSLEQAHANLAEWNRRSLREHRVSVGATCVAVREGEAMVAQVGPSLAFVAGPDGPRRLSTADLPAAEPLGGAAEIEPRFTSLRLDREQVLVVSSRVEASLGADAIAEVASSGAERALAELFRLTRELGDVTAALVADLELTEEQVAPRLEPEPAAAAPRRASPAAPPAEPRPSGSGGGGFLDRWFGTRGQLPTLRRPGVGEPTGRRRPSAPWPLVGGGVLLLVVIAALIWVVGPRLISEDRDAAIAEALAAAEASVEEAFATEDTGDRRAALEQALASVERARSLDAPAERVDAIAAAAEQELDRLNAVVAVEPLSTRFTFAGVLTAPVQPQQLVAGGGRLWLLESDLGRVFSIDPNDTLAADEVYVADALYGGVAAREPVAMAWDDTGGRLLVLDGARSLFAIAPEGGTPAVLPLRDAAELRGTDAMTSYLGNLYLLDGGSGEVWRYLPGGEGYDSERDGLLGSAAIEQAVDLTVTGDIYVLDGGNLRRFVRGIETAPLLTGLDVPLASPSAVLRDSARGVLYVVDVGNRRVVVADQTGTFLRQYQHPEFFDLRGIALSEDSTRLYLLTGVSIVSFDPDQEPPGGSLAPE